MKRMHKWLAAACLAVACGALAGCGGVSLGTSGSTQAGGSGQQGGVYPLTVETVYALAQEAGYTGTLEDLIAMFKGADGKDGQDGKDGSDGQDGATWLIGEGAPSAESGKIGDLYLDTSSYDLWHKEEKGWQRIGNIKGADGQDGGSSDSSSGDSSSGDSSSDEENEQPYIELACSNDYAVYTTQQINVWGTVYNSTSCTLSVEKDGVELSFEEADKEGWLSFEGWLGFIGGQDIGGFDYYLTFLTAGDYTVKLVAVGDYGTAEKTVSVTVSEYVYSGNVYYENVSCNYGGVGVVNSSIWCNFVFHAPENTVATLLIDGKPAEENTAVSGMLIKESYRFGRYEINYEITFTVAGKYTAEVVADGGEWGQALSSAVVFEIYAPADEFACLYGSLPTSAEIGERIDETFLITYPKGTQGQPILLIDGKISEFVSMNIEGGGENFYLVNIYGRLQTAGTYNLKLVWTNDAGEIVYVFAEQDVVVAARLDYGDFTNGQKTVGNTFETGLYVFSGEVTEAEVTIGGTVCKAGETVSGDWGSASVVLSDNRIIVAVTPSVAGDLSLVYSLVCDGTAYTVDRSLSVNPFSVDSYVGVYRGEAGWGFFEVNGAVDGVTVYVDGVAGADGALSGDWGTAKYTVSSADGATRVEITDILLAEDLQGWLEIQIVVSYNGLDYRYSASGYIQDAEERRKEYKLQLFAYRELFTTYYTPKEGGTVASFAAEVERTLAAFDTLSLAQIDYRMNTAMDNVDPVEYADLIEKLLMTAEEAEKVRTDILAELTKTYGVGVNTLRLFSSVGEFSVSVGDLFEPIADSVEDVNVLMLILYKIEFQIYGVSGFNMCETLYAAMEATMDQCPAELLDLVKAVETARASADGQLTAAYAEAMEKLAEALFNAMNM